MAVMMHHEYDIPCEWCRYYVYFTQEYGCALSGNPFQYHMENGIMLNLIKHANLRCILAFINICNDTKMTVCSGGLFIAFKNVNVSRYFYNQNDINVDIDYGKVKSAFKFICNEFTMNHIVKWNDSKSLFTLNFLHENGFVFDERILYLCCYHLDCWFAKDIYRLNNIDFNKNNAIIKFFVLNLDIDSIRKNVAGLKEDQSGTFKLNNVSLYPALFDYRIV